MTTKANKRTKTVKVNTNHKPVKRTLNTAKNVPYKYHKDRRDYRKTGINWKALFESLVFAEMSVHIPTMDTYNNCRDKANVATNVSVYSKKMGIRFSYRSMPQGGCRIWRIS